MINAIKEGGGSVRAYDPIANEMMNDIIDDIKFFESWEEACLDADGVAIMTEWNEFRAINLEQLKKIMNEPVLLDTRNIINIKKLNEHNFKFDNVGRGDHNAH